MISIVVPAAVALAFALSIISVWVIKPGSKLWKMRDTGYDKDRPPSKKEWRSVQIGYTMLLVFLGALFTVLARLSLSD